MQADELKSLRASLGITQQEMGNAIGMSRKSIVEMETGRSAIERRTAIALTHLAMTAQFKAIREDLIKRTNRLKAGSERLMSTDPSGVHDLTDETVIENERRIAELDALIERGDALSRVDENA